MSNFKFILLLALCGACQTPAEMEVMEIRQVLEQQVSAWNRGDIAAYMSGYLNDPGLIFTGGKSKTIGWQKALDRYEKAYPSKEAMGNLSFEDLQIELISPQAAFATGAWRLDRMSDTLQGRFTLIWKKVNGDWVIIADHSS